MHFPHPHPRTSLVSRLLALALVVVLVITTGYPGAAFARPPGTDPMPPDTFIPGASSPLPPSAPHSLPGDALIEDHFDAENSGVGIFVYTNFTNWIVTQGSVDLIGNGFLDLVAGHGLYLDMNGSTHIAGTLESKRDLAMDPGLYKLEFDLAGSQRGDTNTVSVSLAPLFQENFQLDSNFPFTKITRIIQVFIPTSAKLIISQPPDDPDNFGLLLDNVKLSRLDSTDLALAMMAEPNPVLVQSPLTYTLSVINGGPSIATRVRITDVLPASVILQRAATNQGICSGSSIVVCILNNLGDGEKATITLVVTPTVTGWVTNTATVTGDEFDPGLDNNTVQQTTLVDPSADLEIAKTADPNPVVIENPLTYTLTITNHGPSVASRIVVTDILPASVTFVSTTASQGYCLGGNIVVCHLDPLTKGSQGTITIVVLPTVDGMITNNATVAGQEADITPANNVATQVTGITPAADLAISKTAAPNPVVVDTPLTYTIMVTNNGPSAASEILVTDTLPASTRFVSAAAGQGSCSAGNPVICHLGNLARGTHTTITVVVIPLEDGPITNSAVVAGREIDPHLDNSSTTQITQVTPAADLGITKFATPNPVIMEKTLTYTLLITNYGPSTATHVIITDRLPAAMMLLSARPDQGACAAVDMLVCQLGVLAKGKGTKIIVNMTPSAPGVAFNTATVAGSEIDPDWTNNSATANTVVNGLADLSIAKMGTPDPVTTGNPLTYRIVVTNNGPALANNVRVTDTLPSSVTFGSVSTSQGNCSGTRTIICDLGSLGNTASATITITTGPTQPGAVTNTAWVGNLGAFDIDPDLSNNMGSFISHVDAAVTTAAASILSLTPGETRCFNPGTVVNTLWQGNSWIRSSQPLSIIVDVKGKNMFGSYQGIPAQTWNSAMGQRVQLPVLDISSCETWITIQNLGAQSSKAILVTWGEPGPCAPQAIGPNKAECTGLLKPGASWTYTRSQLPAGAKSAMVYSLDATLDSNHNGVPDADEACEKIFADAFNYKEWERDDASFRNSWGIPINGGFAAAGSPLAVVVDRKCPGDTTPAFTANASYSGISESMTGVYDPIYGGFAYYVPLIWNQGLGGYNTSICIQNSGDECTSVEIYFQQQDQCLHLVLPTPVYAPGQKVNYAPLVYREVNGWQTGIQVQNLSTTLAAKVKVYFTDHTGGVITAIVDWICPAGSQSFYLPIINGLPGNFVGAARIESQDWFSPGTPNIPAPNIMSIVNVIKYANQHSTDTPLEMVMYNALPEKAAFRWQTGPGPGAGLLGVPLVAKAKTEQVYTELAVQNINPNPGFTDFAIYFYDQNGLLDYVCKKLNEKQVAYIDLATWAFVPAGFLGSVIISATYTTQPGGIGLGGVTIQRTGRSLMDPQINGDESSGNEIFPIFGPFSFGLGQPPTCPGQP
ncbi:MAG: DUF11 domain-containing protein [Chloroflexi bacterium]|nr:DUF11 domain-containing protein [Chloroflexota bacterium]